MEKYSLPERNVVFSDRNELDVTMTVALDEYCPNAVRIVRCDLCSMLSDWSVTDGAIEYGGRNVFRVVYVSDYNDSLRSVNFEQEFSGVMKIGTALPEDKTDIYMCARTIHCAAKILSARQLELKGRVMISGNAVSRGEIQLYGDKAESSENICVLEETLEMCEKIRIDCEKAQIESDISLAEGEMSVGEMLYTEICPYVTQSECQDGKLIVSGNVHARFVYVPEVQTNTQQASLANEPVCVTRDIPFETQIYNDSITERGYAFAQAIPVYAKTGVSYDPYGENRVLSLSADMGISGFVYECANVCICTDVFGVGQNVKAEFVPITYDIVCDTAKENIHISEKLHADPRSFSRITDCGVDVRVTGTEVSEGKMYAAVHADASLFGMGENGSANFTQSGFNMKVPISTASNPAEVKADMMIQTKDVHCEIKNGELIVQANAMLYGVMTEKMTTNAVGSISVSENDSDSEKGQIIVYYPESTDTVWSVAKSYSVNPEMLKIANGIEGDSLSGVKTVIITK